MNNMTYWCLPILNALPDQFGEDGIVLSEGFTGDEMPEPDQLQYLLLFRVAAPDEYRAHSTVREALPDADIAEVLTLSADSTAMVRSERRIAARLSDGDVYIKSNCIGYKKADNAARDNAISVIRAAVVRAKWQFWR